MADVEKPVRLPYVPPKVLFLDGARSPVTREDLQKLVTEQDSDR